MSFSFSFVANKKRKKRTKRKRKHATASYALTSVVQMDVASRACTLTLTIGATHVNILSASISKIQNFIFYIQACLKVTFHARTHVRGANVVHLIKIIMNNRALLVISICPQEIIRRNPPASVKLSIASLTAATSLSMEVKEDL